jgi:thermostable 8-oxoguanine DNA glycosylase
VDIAAAIDRGGNLAVEDMLLIVKWKTGLLRKDYCKRIVKSIGKIRSAINMVRGDEARTETALQMLCEVHGVGLPLASAMLAVCYPDRYAILDFRVLDELGFEGAEARSGKWKPDSYVQVFLPKVRCFARQLHVELQQADRILWGRSQLKDISRYLGGRKVAPCKPRCGHS